MSGPMVDVCSQCWAVVRPKAGVTPEHPESVVVNVGTRRNPRPGLTSTSSRCAGSGQPSEKILRADRVFPKEGSVRRRTLPAPVSGVEATA